MRVEEILEDVRLFGGDRIDHMAGQFTPSGEEDPHRKDKEEASQVHNERRRRIRKALAKVRNRNKPWDEEDKIEASPTTGEHDLGSSDANIWGVMKGTNRYPGHQGI